MTVRIGTSLAALAMATLAACGGGGGDDDSGSSGGPTTGLPDPGDIVDADPRFVDALNQQIAIAESDLALAGRTDLPFIGSATYSGAGSIFDAALTSADTSVAALSGRAVVSDVSATVNFRAGSLDVTQTDFIDVEGNPVAGSVGWTGTYDSQGRVFNATVNGNVGVTSISTGTDQATAGFFGDAADSAILGLFENATTSGSTWQGASGSFAATSD